MENEPLFVYAHLNARIGPIDRGDRYEDPLAEAFEQNGFGEVCGGGTLLEHTGETSYCGIDINLIDASKGIPFLIDMLTKLGAPKGSQLEFTSATGEKKVLPFGEFEGLAIYFNGTDLPAEVYQTCDINFVWEEITRLIGEKSSIQGHWQGPTETALYLYGPSIAEMKKSIADFAQNYPLFEKARFETIAQ